MRHREHQRDVDVDALGDELLNRRNPFGRGRHLDHQVGTFQLLKITPRFSHCAFRVEGQVGVDLKTDVAVLAGALLIDRQEQAGRHADVLQRQRFIHFADACPTHHHFLQLFIVVVAVGDGLLKDGRVGSDAAHSLVNERLQFPRRDKGAPDVVQPD